jgi:hypothetical protein
MASRVLRLCVQMTEKLIVMPGFDGLDLHALQAVATEFGWTVNVVRNLADLADAQADGKTAAVFFHRDALGSNCSWFDAIRLLKGVAPALRLVACHGFQEPIDWPRLCDAGAFHALWLPFKENEVRRSLGFISEAEKRMSLANLDKAISTKVRGVKDALAMGSTGTGGL